MFPYNMIGSFGNAADENTFQVSLFQRIEVKKDKDLPRWMDQQEKKRKNKKKEKEY